MEIGNCLGDSLPLNTGRNHLGKHNESGACHIVIIRGDVLNQCQEKVLSALEIASLDPRQHNTLMWVACVVIEGTDASRNQEFRNRIKEVGFVWG